MTIAIDASITMAWCFEDEATDGSEEVLERLVEQGAVTPALWRLEVANVLAVAERKKRITEAQTTRFIALLNQLPIDVVVEPTPMIELLELSRRHGLSAYDATYLRLSASQGLELATLDDKLASAAEAAGVTCVPAHS